MSKIDAGTKDLLSGKDNWLKVFLVIFFSVGVTGFAIPGTRDFFIHLTPLALLLSAVALTIFHKTEHTGKNLLIFSLIFVLSFLVEAAGVNSGLLFGRYSYGSGLGIKLLGTPLMIGINWLLLVYCTSIIANALPAGTSLKILIASLLMVIYDVILEQIAPMLDMWQFEGGIAPLQNYISWFIVALIFHLIIKLAGIRFNNRIAAFVFSLQLAFFVVILLILKVL